MNPKYGFKNYNDSSIYCRVIRKNKKIKTKKITTFSRENVRENNKKFIENNKRRKKVKITNSKRRDTICGPSPKCMGLWSNEPNTINL